jgi:hypothetical protein
MKHAEALGARFDPEIKPDGAVERAVLVQQEVFQFVAEGVGVRVGREVAHLLAPCGEGVHHAPDDLPHARFAFGRAELPAEVFGDDHIRRQLAPEGGRFHIVLFEHHAPALVGDDCCAPFPLDCVEGVYARAGEASLDSQPCARVEVIELFAGDVAVAFGGAAGFGSGRLARRQQLRRRLQAQLR